MRQYCGSRLRRKWEQSSSSLASQAVTGRGPSIGGQAAPVSRLDTAGLANSPPAIQLRRRRRIANTIVSHQALA